MKYVLDSNLALKWVLNEPDSHLAHRLRSEFQRQLHELVSPDVFAIEVAHSLARAERRALISQGEGQQLLTDVLSTPPNFHPYLPLLAGAFALASAARIGVYDCLYVALADQEQCDLLTADDRLVRTFPNKRIISLANLP
jgi:predicted nucleic acid-binding protein